MIIFWGSNPADPVAYLIPAAPVEHEYVVKKSRFIARVHHVQNREEVNALAKEMFDPDKNALHAARILRTEHARHNTWRDAVAAYRAAEAKFIMRSMQRERSNGPNLNAHLLTTSNSTTLGAM